MNTLLNLSFFVIFCGQLTAASMDEGPFPRRVDRKIETGDSPFYVRPMIDTPLRHVQIMRAADKTYYLTGTLSKADRGDDFQNNAGIRLWSSKDLNSWQDMGLVWDLQRDGKGWQRQQRLNPDQPEGELVCGVTAPELHQINGKWYLAYSVNQQGTGLLECIGDKPSGPWRDLGQITAAGGSPSLFAEDDANVYWIWGQGFIAKLRSDLSGLAETPKLMRTSAKEAVAFDAKHKHQGDIEIIYPEGFSITRQSNGKYSVIFSVSNMRLGGLVRDTFRMSASHPMGPYGEPEFLLAHGAEASIFQVDGSPQMSFWGADSWAVHRDRAARVPLNKEGTAADMKRPRRNQDIPFSAITQRGPWDRLQPFVKGLNINDNYLLNAPDGYYYFTGSVWDDEEKFVFRLFRSANLRDWEEWEVLSVAQAPAFTETVRQFRNNPKDPGFKGLVGCPMDAEIHFLKENYWIIFTMYYTDNTTFYPGLDREKKGRGSSLLFRSETGKALGPYTFHCTLSASAMSFFEDTDGLVYMTTGSNTIYRMNPDMNGYEKEFRYDVHTPEGLKFNDDISMNPVKIGDWYAIFNYNGCNQNRCAVYLSKSLTGPYERPQPVSSRGSQGWVTNSKHRDDIYYQVNWGNSMQGSMWNGARPVIIPLKLKLIDGRPSFRSIYDMPEDEARHYQDEIDRLLGPGVWPPTVSNL